MHMWAQVVLQILFPGMFSSDFSIIGSCAKNTFLAHIIVVEPLYYIVHRWLHIPSQMKEMHGFHHMSINTLPSTSLVQDFKEHFIYIATFGPAMLLPYFVGGMNHWIVIAAYLIIFDIVNAWGHTNVRCRNWLFECRWSPLRYLFYTPEFHLGHHALYNANYALFMPYWDHLFCTYREYKKPQPATKPLDQQDFVFIGHNGGLGHTMTIPEVSVYNVYDAYCRTWLPIKVELLITAFVVKAWRVFATSYRASRYLVDNRYIGRVICVLRSPLEYFSKTHYADINNDIIDLIEQEHKNFNTRLFGLGNLNKMRQLNDGGSVISGVVKEHPYLKDKNIRIWTGDTLTSASIYHQLIGIQNLKKIFYIGGTGKIGVAVTQLLINHGIEVCVFSRYVVFEHPLVTYTDDMSKMKTFEHVVIGKMINPKLYESVLQSSKTGASSCGAVQTDVKTKYLLDYTVPFMPLSASSGSVKHLQIGVLSVSPDSTLLKGHYDVCFGVHENEIYPCHAGCIVNMVTGRTTDETGDINVDEIVPLWKTAKGYGLDNRKLLLE